MWLDKTRIFAFLAVLSLLAAGLACNLPGLAGESVAPTNTPIPITTESVTELQEEIQSAGEAIETGQPVTVSVTEEQLTSIIAFELQKQDQQMVSDPQVRLRDGQIQFTANVSQSGFELPLEVVIEVFLDGTGEIDYRIVSADLGPFPLSDEMLDQLSAQFEGSFRAQLREQTKDIEIEEVTIADGVMTITGRQRT
ncbi:MAG TPA: hypothetical protein VLS48_08310 [Anaerolineales bacterium]|nr:hypothetical protein [Anaerolineales bacterium]